MGIVVFATVVSAQAHTSRHFRALVGHLGKDGLWDFPQEPWLPTAWPTSGCAPWRTSSAKSAPSSRTQVREVRSGAQSQKASRDSTRGVGGTRVLVLGGATFPALLTPPSPRGVGGTRVLVLGGATSPALPNAALSPPCRNGDPGTVQGENERAASRPAGGSLHRFCATRGGGAVGSDPLPNPGGCV